MKTPVTARAAAVLYALWGIVHVAGGLYQVITLRAGGATALAALLTGSTAGVPVPPVPGAAEAFMGMAAANIALIGAAVTAVALLNWRNTAAGYWTNLVLAGGTDLTLVAFLLAPGVMAWSDGLLGLGLFIPAAVLATLARRHPSALAHPATSPAAA